MARDFFFQATLPLFIETAVALGVLVLGTLALRGGRRWAWFAVAAGALWGGVQAVYCVDYLAVELGLESTSEFLYEHGLLTPMRYLRLLGLALLLPALAGAASVSARRPQGSRATGDQARSGA